MGVRSSTLQAQCSCCDVASMAWRQTPSTPGPRRRPSTPHAFVVDPLLERRFRIGGISSSRDAPSRSAIDTAAERERRRRRLAADEVARRRLGSVREAPPRRLRSLRPRRCDRRRGALDRAERRDGGSCSSRNFSARAPYALRAPRTADLVARTVLSDEAADREVVAAQWRDRGRRRARRHNPCLHWTPPLAADGGGRCRRRILRRETRRFSAVHVAPRTRPRRGAAPGPPATGRATRHQNEEPSPRRRT